jgi:hypothetical protein
MTILIITIAMTIVIVTTIIIIPMTIIAPVVLKKILKLNPTSSQQKKLQLLKLM